MKRRTFLASTAALVVRDSRPPWPGATMSMILRELSRCVARIIERYGIKVR